MLAKTSLLFFVIVFLFSCEEDVNTVGFKPDRNSFRVRYAEIELPSSVIMPGGVITSNKSGDGETPRLLVGSYLDNKFGKVTAESFIQFRPSSPTTVLPPDAVLQSLVLSVSLDYYNYGSRDASTVNFYVHEVKDSLITEGRYFNNSVVDYDPAVIGTVSKTIDPVSFDDAFTKNADADATNNVIDSLLIPINSTYANNLFQLAKTILLVPNSTTGKNDTTTTANYYTFRKFRRIFKGLSITSDATNKIIGINPSYVAAGLSRSKLVLTYSYKSGTKTGKIEFSTYSSEGSISFSRITADRAGSSLQSVDELYKPFYPDGDNRFVQSGSPIVTKIDFSKYFSYTDTIKNLLINSAEIVINPDETTSYKMPDNIGFRVLNAKNDYVKSTDTIPSLYTGFIVSDAEGYLVLGEGTTSGSSISNLALTQTNNVYSYNALLSRYFQFLYSVTDKTQRLSQYALVPVAPRFGKSVNRLIFNQNNLKLKLYYTTPVAAEKK